MKYFLKILFITTLLSFSLHGFSDVTIAECEDENGALSFHMFCPPNSSQVGSKKLQTNPDKKKKTDLKATLYIIPNCSECDEFKEYLESKDITITIKNADSSIDIQNELTDISGDLKVPTAVINDELIIGYQRDKINAILEQFSEEGGEDE